MLKKMMEKRNQKGFTLMEMLIVVAIIAILVAIAIPVFTSQLEKAKEATDLANIRAAIAEVTSNYLDGKDELSKDVTIQQGKEGWITTNVANVGGVDLSALSVAKPDTVTVKYDPTADPAITVSEGTSSSSSSTN